MEISELFWDANAEQLKVGYVEEKEDYVCLLCGERVEKGIIYPEATVLYEAERYMKHHIEKEHVSVFHYLIGLNKKLTGLTDHQNSLLRLFYEGKSDADIQAELSIGSASTIRNHRFVLKEKERQAKIFITMMELLKEKDSHAPTFLPLHKTATMVDERYNITKEEQEEIEKKFFSKGIDGPLIKFPKKEKQKLATLRVIIQRFDLERVYKEKEINEVLKNVYADYVTLRRYLIEYGFLDRKDDGSEYWVKK
ncbi:MULTISPECIES: DUF2087 domain-containing protein [Bacillaceae]|uniref:DUF2087 domain-containing protein n=1 Tax=Bacillaceae TaxID=186817 RepID=UPI0006AE9749|nr:MULTISPECIES: DUF2087 domain-containing protein [Bacillaceae]ALC86995.1 transcriptional regulator [Bacillus sp. FJAT-22090]KQL37463.1 transcriptional regulator [Psychrobacillus sp. FJAT-21963]MDF2064905.1 DUF2087 domain-containing protein [Bacillus sp. Cr_A10]